MLPLFPNIPIWVFFPIVDMAISSHVISQKLATPMTISALAHLHIFTLTISQSPSSAYLN